MLCWSFMVKKICTKICVQVRTQNLPFVMVTAPMKFTFICSTKSETDVLSSVPFKHTPARPNGTSL